MRNEPWAIFWMIVVAMICLLTYGCSYQSDRNDERKQRDVAALISKGSSPQAARCAVYGTNNDSNAAITCQTVAVTEAMNKAFKQPTK